MSADVTDAVIERWRHLKQTMSTDAPKRRLDQVDQVDQVDQFTKVTDADEEFVAQEEKQMVQEECDARVILCAERTRYNGNFEMLHAYLKQLNEERPPFLRFLKNTALDPDGRWIQLMKHMEHREAKERLLGTNYSPRIAMDTHDEEVAFETIAHNIARKVTGVVRTGPGVERIPPDGTFQQDDWGDAASSGGEDEQVGSSGAGGEDEQVESSGAEPVIISMDNLIGTAVAELEAAFKILARNTPPEETTKNMQNKLIDAHLEGWDHSPFAHSFDWREPPSEGNTQLPVRNYYYRNDDAPEAAKLHDDLCASLRRLVLLFTKVVLNATFGTVLPLHGDKFISDVLDAVRDTHTLVRDESEEVGAGDESDESEPEQVSGIVAKERVGDFLLAIEPLMKRIEKLVKPVIIATDSVAMLAKMALEACRLTINLVIARGCVQEQGFVFAKRNLYVMEMEEQEIMTAGTASPINNEDIEDEGGAMDVSPTMPTDGRGQGDAGGWPSSSGNPSGGGRSNNV